MAKKRRSARWFYDSRWHLRDHSGRESCVRCRNGVFRDAMHRGTAAATPNPHHRFGYHRHLESAIAEAW
jgi:hypothetical protein